jgi:hypothetical protein
MAMTTLLIIAAGAQALRPYEADGFAPDLILLKLHQNKI